MIDREAIGEVRPSQLLTAFGPGAIVDLQTLSVIVGGIDRWPVHQMREIREARLQKALRVDKFLCPQPMPNDPGRKWGSIPTYVFPRYHVCPVDKCRALVSFDGPDVEYDLKAKELLCKVPGCPGEGKRRATLVPAPFVMACPEGHLDDFPWRTYVHRGATACAKRMKLVSNGRTGSVGDLMVECACEVKRSVSDAFGENRAEALGECTRRRPWLGLRDEDATCVTTTDASRRNDLRAMQRGATNGWFPLLRSAITIKETASPIGQALAACDQKQIANITTKDNLELLLKMSMFPSLAAFSADEVWEAIQKSRGEVPVDDIDLRLPEWAALRDPKSANSQKAELFLEPGEVPKGLGGLIKQVVLARKLMEVRALVGFTRIDPASSVLDDEPRVELAPISRTKPDWLPGVETRGEGIFIELDEGEVAKWEARSAVKAAVKKMADNLSAWESERGMPPAQFPGARFVLLHTLAHTLIRQLSLDCGYSASSVRERIYSSTDPLRPMAGVLLYTASADSEGSLGGLVDLGSKERFPDLLSGALQSIAQCSSDPLCADHQPDIHASINAAACHACVLASETSCEAFNRLLDRNVLVPTMAKGDLAYFPDPFGSPPPGGGPKVPAAV